RDLRGEIVEMFHVLVVLLERLHVAAAEDRLEIAGLAGIAAHGVLRLVPDDPEAGMLGGHRDRGAGAEVVAATTADGDHRPPAQCLGRRVLGLWRDVPVIGDWLTAVRARVASAEGERAF